ncbi:MAG TPA: tetratricopeptide repeat protein, partial [Terriglobia bacterium]|nr:tetratricopeptide repeat protein [Terriglobia bacterium]
RLDDAIAHLESARRRSSSPSVYSQLAIAYRRHGNLAESQKMLKALAGLNQQDADRHKVASPDHMASYMGTRAQ